MDVTSGAMEPGRGAAAPLSVAAVDAEPPPSTAEAVDKAIVTDDSMDPDILKKEVMAHYKAVGAVTEANPVMPKEDSESIIAEIDRMIASVPDSETMDAYNPFSAFVPRKFYNI